MVQVGMTAPTATVDTIRMVMKRLSLSGSLGGTMEDTRQVIQMMGSGQLVPERRRPSRSTRSPRGSRGCHSGAVQGRLVAVIDG